MHKKKLSLIEIKKPKENNRNVTGRRCLQTAVIQFEPINHWEYVDALLTQTGSGLICLSMAQSPQTSVSFTTPETAP